MPVKYVFWDSDNTLVKTYDHHWNKHFETLKSHGIHLGDEWKEQIYTNNGAQNWEWLNAELGLATEKQTYLDEIDGWYHRHISSIALREGVAAALDLFESAGLPMAVVSNGRTRSVTPALRAKNLYARFRFVLCKEDYEGRKPDPTPYLAAKTRMQQIIGAAIDARDCLVIEDDPKGVESGLAAGMQVLHRPLGDDDPEKFLGRCRAFISA
jgi:HAD superfamily hydrolase (TIGR01509 family)